MSERRCRYCEKTFHPSKHQPRQTVCGQTECQKRRRTESRQKKLATDGEYRQVCLDSASKWRAANPEYWKRYREKNPESVARNRKQQQNRDRKQRLVDLLRNKIMLRPLFLPGMTGSTGGRACKQQLSFRSKALSNKDLASEPQCGRYGKSPKEQNHASPPVPSWYDRFHRWPRLQTTTQFPRKSG
jgi:hypothetical protein